MTFSSICWEPEVETPDITSWDGRQFFPSRFRWTKEEKRVEMVNKRVVMGMNGMKKRYERKGRKWENLEREREREITMDKSYMSSPLMFMMIMVIIIEDTWSSLNFHSSFPPLLLFLFFPSHPVIIFTFSLHSSCTKRTVGTNYNNVCRHEEKRSTLIVWRKKKKRRVRHVST